ncbi:MAG: hypothetical protein G01um101448_140 [Parcubacteria group bacterium Gr01-1014_48]|nr:MAG: hypothetical protein Greene041614_95 [Parcubacteria group bacterium Greene0416_14]TSC74413.1 MAG: hypothetical protein G01um101448_140 [Parcubacteria group bacterium Gr01-1014_48]TSD01266.1 MAG: hypothetical protein Greene101415_355 [Parcubacteria group bacterium Greene1014_15]TSD08413.1 MAG: hypothetical protein Greene07144_129 [Parcubacteria group bacterium Greene0714_4]
MPLPPNLAEHPEDTAVVGDIEAFIEYVESGQAFLDWNERLAQRRKELEELF